MKLPGSRSRRCLFCTINVFSLLFLFTTGNASAQTWRAKDLGILANGTDQSANIRRAFARADVQTIWFAGDSNKNAALFLINEEVRVPAGKVLKFDAGNRLYSSTPGKGHVVGGIIDAGYPSWIFDPSIQMDFTAVAGSWVSVKWFGATGNGRSDDQPAIDSAIRTCIRNNATLQQLLLPNGVYRITKPLIARQRPGVGTFTLDISGETGMWGDGGTIIQPTFNNTFAIGIQRGKGCKVQKLKLYGKFIPPDSNNDPYNYFNLPFDEFKDVAAGEPARDEVFSPYAGIVIDPFTNYTTDTAGLSKGKFYPGLEKEYGASNDRRYAGSGSTAIVVSDVMIAGFVVGILSSPNGSTRNAEMTRITQVKIANCKLGISGGQHQEKTNVIDGLAAWMGIHTVFATGRYGLAETSLVNSGNWNISNVNVVGAVTLIYNNQGGWFPVHLSNIYTESLGSFGMLTSGSSTLSSNASEVRDCSFNFNYYHNSGFQVLATTNQGVTFKNCAFRYNDNSRTMMLFDARSVFQDCSFSGVPVQVSELYYLNWIHARAQYINCIAGTDHFGRNQFKTSNKNFDGYLNYNNITLTDYASEITGGVVEKYALMGKDVFVNFVDTNISIRVNINTDRSASIPVSNRFAYGSGKILLFSTTPVNPAYCSPVGYGLITHITPGTGNSGTLTVKHISKPARGGVVNGNAYYISCLYPARHSGTFMGDITSATNISNVVVDWGLAAASYSGQLVKIPYGNAYNGWMKVIDVQNTAGNISFTILGNQGTSMNVKENSLYFNNGASKSIEVSTTLSQALAATRTPVIVYKGQKITEMAFSDRSAGYECLQTGFLFKTMLPAGDVRRAVYQPLKPIDATGTQ